MVAARRPIEALGRSECLAVHLDLQPRRIGGDRGHRRRLLIEPVDAVDVSGGEPFRFPDEDSRRLGFQRGPPVPGKQECATVHDRTVVVMPYVVAGPEGLREIEGGSLVNVLRQYAHMVIAVVPPLLVKKTRRMSDFMDHRRHAAVVVKQSNLLATGHADERQAQPWASTGLEPYPVGLIRPFRQLDDGVFVPVLDGVENSLRLGQVLRNNVRDDAAGPKEIGVAPGDSFLGGVQTFDELRALGRLQFLRGSENNIAFNNGQSVNDLVGDLVAPVDARADIERFRALGLSRPDRSGN